MIFIISYVVLTTCLRLINVFKYLSIILVLQMLRLRNPTKSDRCILHKTYEQTFIQ